MALSDEMKASRYTVRADTGIAYATIADPGDAGAIPVSLPGSVGMTSGAVNETRTLADPSYLGQELGLSLAVYGGGEIAVTAASPVSQTGANVITFADAGDYAKLEAAAVGAGFEWRVASFDGIQLTA